MKEQKISIIISAIAVLIALVGGVPGFISIYRSIKNPTALIFEIEPEQVIISRFSSKNKNVDGKACIGIYQLSITGKSNNPTTIKKIEALVKIKNKWIEANQYIVCKQESSCRSNVIKLSNGIEKIFISAWNDNTIRESKVKIEFGETVITSLTYFLDISDQELYNINKIKLEIQDYLGRKYYYKYNITDKNFNGIRKGLYIIDYPCDDCINSEN